MFDSLLSVFTICLLTLTCFFAFLYTKAAPPRVSSSSGDVQNEAAFARVYVWGRNEHAELGLPASAPLQTPKCLADLHFSLETTAFGA